MSALKLFLGKGHVHLVAVRFAEDWFVKKLSVVVADEEIVHIGQEATRMTLQ
jgi:uncharacterized membrane protein